MRKHFSIAGADGGGGGSSGGGTESPDSLKSSAIVSILDLIGEGQIGGLVDGSKSIYLDGTPVTNADGTDNFGTDVQFNERKGVSQPGSNIELASYLIPDVENPHQLDIKIPKSSPNTVTITDPNVDVVKVVLSVPALFYQNTSNGDTSGTTVQYQFAISVNGGAYVDHGDVQTIQGKTRSKYQVSHAITLPKPFSTISIRTTRITDDSTVSTLGNDLYIDVYSEVYNSGLSYPNSALIAMRLNSSRFSSLPARSYLVDGLLVKIPSNYVAATNTYSGIWDGTFILAVSSNPAWVLYDLLTNTRYGLGDFISSSQVDKARLYTIGKYCDELVPDGLGGMEKRFSLNTQIATQREAFKVISDITSVFRGMIYWADGLVGFTQDAPTDSTMIYSQANVVDGLFTYTGSARKDRHSVVHVTYNDPTDSYKQKIEYVDDQKMVSKYGIRKIDVVAFGCTSRGQAARVGRWILFTEQYESDLITFKGGLDSSQVAPGEVVRINDAQRAGKRMAGRVNAASTTSLTFDAPVVIGATGATVSVRLPDGSFATRPILEGVGTFTTVTWVSALTQVPAANAMFIVAEPSLTPMLARVISKAQDGVDQYTITAIEHNPSKYTAIENGLALAVQTTNTIVGTPSAPTNLVLIDNVYVSGASLQTKLDISWTDSQKGVRNWEVRVRQDSQNWKTYTTTTPNLEVLNVQDGSTYYVEVDTINIIGRTSPVPATDSLVIAGKTAPPADVTNFTVSVASNGILLGWVLDDDVDYAETEIRIGADWDTGVKLTSKSSTSHLMDFRAAGTYQIWAKNIDTTGNYSVNAAPTSIVIAPPNQVAISRSDVQINTVALGWLDAKSSQPIKSYSIYTGSAGDPLSACTLYGKAGSDSRSDVVIFRSAGAKRIYLIAEDVAGNTSTPTSMDITVTLPTNFVLSSEWDENWSGTKTNAYVDDGALYLPANAAETWASHFSSNGWTNSDAQVSAGYPLAFEPGPTSGSYTETHDCGKIIPSAKISVTTQSTTLAGSVLPSVLIEWSTDNTTWTAGAAGVTDVQVAQVRYVRVTYSVTSSGGDDLLKLTRVHVVVSSEEKSEFATLNLVSTDSAGTVYTCTKTFLDVVSAIATPSNSSNIARLNVIIDDTVSPAKIYVQAWDISNARTGGQVSLQIGGY